MYKNILTAAQVMLMIFPLAAAASEDDPPVNEADYLVVAHKGASPPKIDGRLDDPFWADAVVVDNFTQYEPREGAAPSEKTVAYIGYDSKNLYIGVRCFDSDPKAVRACLVQRDKVMGDDEVTIYLDTYNDKKRAFAFLVNPCGVQSDGIYNETQRRHRGGGGGGFTRIDKNWDTFFHSDAVMDDEGYSVELSIPFKSIRFPDSSTQTWGFQIQRNIRRKNEEIYWHPRSRNVNGFLVQAGQLQIGGNLEKGRNFEVMPVTTALKEGGGAIEPEIGLNLKYGITSNLTADVTFNPDFSQIEADIPQIEVNQRYEVYYPEKRPFFLEGKDHFDTPIELVYTRNITTPIWGGKLTGKLGKTTMGLLSTYDRAPTDIDLPGAPEQELSRGFVNVFRLKQDIYAESYIGAIFADKETGQDWGSISSNHNRVAGVDGQFKLGRYNRLTFQLVGSDSAVGDQTTGVTPAAQFDFSHVSRRWSLSASYTHLPPDFEAAMGYIRRKDIRQVRTRVGYNILPMNDVIVDIRPSIEYRRAYDFDGILTDEEVQIGGFISGWRGTYFFGNYTNELERYEGIDFHRQGIRMSIGSDPLKWIGGRVGFSAGDSIYYDDDPPYLGYKITYSATVTLRPITNFRLFYTFRNDTFWKDKGGELEYKVNIISQRITYQLSRHLGLRLVTDYNDYDGDLYNSLLFSYQLNPGTVFYLGMDDSRLRDEGGIFRNEGTFYFVKFSYWWRF
jgi:hypothetical protein